MTIEDAQAEIMILKKRVRQLKVQEELLGARLLVLETPAPPVPTFGQKIKDFLNK